jgi:hypothetical protein
VSLIPRHIGVSVMGESGSRTLDNKLGFVEEVWWEPDGFHSRRTYRDGRVVESGPEDLRAAGVVIAVGDDGLPRRCT